MTAAIAAGQYSVPPTVGITVQLNNQTISKVSYNKAATATYTLNSNGNVVGDPGGTLEAWLTGTGANSANYEVLATQTSGATVSGTLGTWTNCNPSNAWSLSNAGYGGSSSVLTGVITVQVRDISTHTVQASASITLSAESDSIN